MMSPVIYKSGTVYFRIDSDRVSLTDALELTRGIKDLVAEKHARIVVADTRNMVTEYPPEIDKIFIELFKTLPPHVDKYVAICHNAVTKLETNYIFKQVGIEDRFRAFVMEDEQEVIKFSGLTTLEWE
jgi:hypothetical protein